MKKLIAAALLALLWAGQAGAQNGSFIQYTPPSIAAGIWGSNLELRDPTQLAAESLTNGALTAGTSWTQTADFALAANAATYTHNTGAGSFQQTSAAAAIPWASTGINGWFTLTYTVSAVTGTPVCTVPSTFALAAQTLVSENGTYSVTFEAMATTVGDFKVSCTSGAAATITFDTLSLKMVNGGNLTVNGRVYVGAGTAALPSISSISGTGTGVNFATALLTLSVSGAGRWGIDSSQLYPILTDTQSVGLASNAIQHVFVLRSTQGSKSKALTDAAAATAFVTVAVPTNGWAGGELIWTATSVSGSDQLVANGSQRFWGSDTAGTPVCGINKIGTDGEGHSGGANTLVCTWTSVASGTTCPLLVTCTNNLAGTQAITVYGRLNMPTANTLVFP